jgi:hypothetical protein
MENTQEPTQVNMQVEFTIMQFKLQLLALAKDIVAQDNSLGTIIEVYLDLREEVLGIPKDIKINTKE